MPMDSQSPILSLKNAEIYQGDHLILSQVNLEMHKGDFIYLIGATGSGKSSLLKTLYADLPLTVGDGEFVGYDLRNLKDKDIPFLRRNLGIVFQDFQLLMDRSVFDNLDFVLQATGHHTKSENSDRIQQVLKRMAIFWSQF